MEPYPFKMNQKQKIISSLRAESLHGMNRFSTVDGKEI